MCQISVRLLDDILAPFSGAPGIKQPEGLRNLNCFSLLQYSTVLLCLVYVYPEASEANWCCHSIQKYRNINLFPFRLLRIARNLRID